MTDIEKAILTKRFQTTMIGALFEFEKVFGHLWGQHKDDENDLTDKELESLDKWDSVRNQILNNGNNQLRKAISDLGHSVKYKYKFNNRNHKNEE